MLQRLNLVRALVLQIPHNLQVLALSVKTEDRPLESAQTAQQLQPSSRRTTRRRRRSQRRRHLSHILGIMGALLR